MSLPDDLPRSANVSRSIVLVMLGAALCGCHGYQPPLPPDPPLSIYEAQPAHANNAPEALACIRVAGARLAKRGLYIDLEVQCSSPETGCRNLARDLGWQLSTADDPTEYLQVTDPSGALVSLHPFKQPFEPFDLIQTRHYGDPPTYELADGRCIQVCMFRTKPLAAGDYSIRFTEAWTRDDRVGAITEPVDREWHQFSVQSAGPR